MKKEKRIIGRTDKADFPEWDIYDLDIKMDTGAYTSSIHCHHIIEREKDGVQFIEFELLDPSHDNYNKKIYRSSNYSYRRVKNSFGTSERRYVVKTKIVLFNQKFPIELTLSERGEMKYPVLIGRRFLTKRFIVDTALKDLSNTEKKKG